MNRPETEEGWQLWDLVVRIERQVRASGGVILGWDLGAALALAVALGVDAWLVAETLPDIEAAAIAARHERAKG